MHIKNIKLKISKEIIDTQTDLSSLLDEYNSFLSDGFKAISIEGGPGSGKTTILIECAKIISDNNSTIILSKFESKKDNTAISLSIFISKIVDLFLALPFSKYEIVKEQLNKTLGNNKYFITHLCPKAEILFNDVKETTNLDYTKLKDRLKITIFKFVKYASEIFYPLIFFIDDLQWADDVTFYVFDYIINHNNQINAFLVFTYRNNENIDIAYLENIINKNNFLKIQINNMSLKEVNTLINNIFNNSIEQIGYLTNKAYGATAGNPFYIKQLLHLLIESGKIFFSVEKDSWLLSVDIDQAISMPDSIAEIITKKLSKLSDSNRKALYLCAAYGPIFNEVFISELDFAQDFEYLNSLKDLLTEGYIIKGEKEYFFSHDIIYNTVINSIPSDIKKDIHGQIGFKMISQESNKYNLVTSAMHLVMCDNINIIPEESIYINKLYDAGVLANRTLNVEKAKKIYKLCEKIIEKSNKDFSKISILIKIEQAQSEYLSGNYQIAIQKLNNELTKNHSKENIAELKFKLLLINAFLNNYEKVIDLGEEVLMCLSFPISRKKTNYYIAKNSIRIFTTKKKITQPILKNSKANNLDFFILNILGRMSFASYFINRKALVLFTTSIMRVSYMSNQKQLKYVGTAAYCFTHLSIFNRPDLIKKLLFSLDLNVDTVENNYLSTLTNFVYGAFIVHLTKPLEKSVKFLEAALTSTTLSCDLSLKNYCQFMLNTHKYILGYPLQYIEDDSNESSITTTIYNHHVSYLKCKDDTSIYLSDSYINKMNNTEKAIYYYYLIQRLYFNFDIEKAYIILCIAKPYEKSIFGHLMYTDYIFIASMIRLEMYRDLSEHNKEKNIVDIKYGMKYFKRLSSLNENHLARYEILKAKYGEILFWKKDFHSLVEQASQLCIANHYYSLEALCYLLLSKSLKTERLCKYYSYEAAGVYRKIGFTKLVNNLIPKVESEIKELEENVLPNEISPNHAIAIKNYGKTISTMAEKDITVYTLNLILNYSQADHISLFIEKENNLRIEYIGYKNKGIIESNVLDKNNVSINIVNFVERSKNDVVINEKPLYGIFAREKVFEKNSKQSILCTQLKYDNIQTGILYLKFNRENILSDTMLNEITNIILSFVAKSVMSSFENETIFLEEPLTLREIDVIQCISQGLTNKAIANELFISYSTVTTHVENIYRKLNVSSRVRAVVKATKAGIIK